MNIRPILWVSQNHTWFQNTVLGLELSKDGKTVEKLWRRTKNNAPEPQDTVPHTTAISSVCKKVELEAKEVTIVHEQIQLLFSLTGLGPEWMLIAKDRKETIADVFRLIYEMPLQSKVAMVNITVCGCNMGHCSTPVEIKVDKNVKTMGDVFATFSRKDDHGYYEYPDLLLLYVRPITTLPPCHENHCGGRILPSSEAMDADYTYVQCFYNR